MRDNKINKLWLNQNDTNLNLSMKERWEPSLNNPVNLKYDELYQISAQQEHCMHLFWLGLKPTQEIHLNWWIF